MTNEGAHVELLKEIKALRDDVSELVALTPQLRAMSDIYIAGKVGGNAIKWLAAIGAAIIGLVAFMKMAAAALARGVMS